MSIIPEIDLKPVLKAAQTISPVLDRLAGALEEHNRIERTKHGLNTDATGATSNAKSEEEHQRIIRDVQAALRQTEG